MTEQKNHGCRYSWCVNTASGSASQLDEHISEAYYIPATGNSLGDYGAKAFEQPVKTVGIGIRYNADIDSGPTVYVNLGSDSEAFLQANEALALVAAAKKLTDELRRNLMLDPHDIKTFLGEGR